MLFHNQKYHLVRYEYFTNGGIQQEKVNYGVYVRCSSGCFGDKIEKGIAYFDLKTALLKMHEHNEKHQGKNIRLNP